MTEQEENELICEKLLGWERNRLSLLDNGPVHWDDGSGEPSIRTPTFTDWSSAGLILDALAKVGVEWDIHTSLVSGGFLAQVILWSEGERRETDWDEDAPHAIRAAALMHIRATEQANAGDT